MIVIEWPALLILATAFTLISWIQSRCQQSGGMDMVPGNGIGQAPDAEMEEGRLGFRN